jgi:hypothetical protein
VSFPSRVVKSIIATAIFNPASFDFVLMLRFANAAARSSAITWSTLGNADILVGDDSPVGNPPARITSVFAVFKNAGAFIRYESADVAASSQDAVPLAIVRSTC